MDEQDQIIQLVGSLSEGTLVKCEDWPENAILRAEDLGLVCCDGNLVWSQDTEQLDEAVIKSKCSTLKVELFQIVDSTNSRLVKRGARESIADNLYLAEFQYGGRGRRGRHWVSPYGRNLAISLGASTRHQIADLGGLSLVVGLALASTFESIGVCQLRLKWPNDVLICDSNGSRRKLSGILVELVQRKQALEYVVGMGVNVSLSELELEVIDQPSTDLRRCGVKHSRTDLVIRLIEKVKQHLDLFESQGFAPFVNAFNEYHLFHNETCSIVQGDKSIVGRVLGVGDQGELVLDTDEGVQRFHGGEVSLRAN